MTIAWLFPGQGTQHVGMGRGLYDSSAAARAVFERADAALGLALTKLCFEGPADELTLTANAQPAIVTTSIAALAALREVHPTLGVPALAAGHSLGEYSALVAASAIEFEDAVRIVRRRGQAMQQAVPEGQGAMAAIMGGDRDSVVRLCAEAAAGEVLGPANYNAPGQVVIAGNASAVLRAAELSAKYKLKAIPLKVSAPFHSPLMSAAAQEVERAFDGVRVRQPSFPIVSNVEAEPNLDAGRIVELLVRQVAAPVLWEQTIRLMAEKGVTHALEIGPGKVLAGLVKRIDKRIDVCGVGDPEGATRARALIG